MLFLVVTSDKPSPSFLMVFDNSLFLHPSEKVISRLMSTCIIYIKICVWNNPQRCRNLLHGSWKLAQERILMTQNVSPSLSPCDVLITLSALWYRRSILILMSVKRRINTSWTETFWMASIKHDGSQCKVVGKVPWGKDSVAECGFCGAWQSSHVSCDIFTMPHSCPVTTFIMWFSQHKFSRIK